MNDREAEPREENGKARTIPVRYFRWIFLGSIAALYVVGLVSGPLTVGENIETTNGQYHVAGGTTPGMMAISAGVLLFYLVLVSSPFSDQGRPLPGVFRRFVAAWLDLLIGMMTLIPLLAIIPSLVEWHRTGEFQWLFERTTPAPWDGWITALLAILCFAGFATYITLPLVRGTPSPGSCIMGYRITTDEGAPMSAGKAAVRTLLGFVALSAWIVAPILGRDRNKGKLWPDKWLGTRAVRLK